MVTTALVTNRPTQALRRSHFADLYPEVPLATVNSLWGCDITRRMQHPVDDEELFMEEALAGHTPSYQQGGGWRNDTSP